MELVSLAKEAIQGLAEQAASYRFGQTVLRHLDRTLWVVEKCARWAVPPPLDQDERPQPELVRPLPWVFFLVMLITLRITRESISLLNLVMGKPPLRSADVVMFIQSKRRYLRTLKYQGNRMMRARTSGVPPRESWTTHLQSLFEFTMCFRRQSPHYANNNTTSISNNDEVLVVKRTKRVREPAKPTTSANESTMERLIEKMLVDLDADTDEDSSFTLTNVTSPKSDRSDFTVDSDQDGEYYTNISNNNDIHNTNIIEQEPNNLEINISTSSTPEDNVTSKEVLASPEVSKEDSRKQFDGSPSKIPRTPNSEVKVANGRPVNNGASKNKEPSSAEKNRRNTNKNNAKGVPANTTM